MEQQIGEHISKLKQLVSDLESLQDGLVSSASFMAMPVLDQWSHSYRKVPCLEGIVEGHPSLPGGHRIVTSEVFARFQADDEHFVRTRSRWYRLGSPYAINKQAGEPTGSAFKG